MKKASRLISLILSVLLLLEPLALPIWAADPVSYQAYTETCRTSVISCDKNYSGNVTIESIHDGTVDKIISKAFSGCKCSKVYIPASVTSIAYDAFDNGSDIIISCSKYSAAYQYAISKGMSYELTVDDSADEIYFENYSYSSADRYTGNQGDSFIAEIGTRNSNK